ncbi:dockerin type I domain-containing protein [Kaarinaea lacus]
MVKKKASLVLGSLGLILGAPTLAADDNIICNGGAKPVLSVADFDANGVVNADDMLLIKKAIKRENYYAFYDVNVDGELDKKDLRRARQDLGMQSTLIDRQLALLFHRVKQYQLVDSKQELQATGFYQIAGSLAGHGEHWTDQVDPVEGDFWRPNGLNVPKNGKSVKGVFWAVDAVPVFENGATDYPLPGGEWETQRVVEFAQHAPKFTVSDEEKWHTHAGLCITVEMRSAGPELVLNQHTTFAECQALPSLVKRPGTDYNFWDNIWMLHAWMFDLNPNGIFANTHPCVDPDSPTEDTINGDRPVPPFFQHHHG